MSLLMDIVNGLDYLIATFKRIICFLASVPRRVSNINAGYKNIFDGINKEFLAIGKSFHDGVSSITLFGVYVGEFIRTYSQCGFKFFANFFSCAFYYIIDIIIYTIKYIIYLFVQLIYLIIYAIFKTDVSYVEKQAYIALSVIDEVISPYLGFSLLNIQWPKSVREQCYMCKRLKTSAVKDKAINIKTTFKETIPNNFGHSRQLFGRGRRQFEEIFKRWTRQPDKVF